MVRITIVVTPSCAEWYALNYGSYAELRRVVRITMVVTPSCAEWYASQLYYTELRRVERIIIVTPSCAEWYSITNSYASYAEWYASQ